MYIIKGLKLARKEKLIAFFVFLRDKSVGEILMYFYGNILLFSVRTQPMETIFALICNCKTTRVLLQSKATNHKAALRHFARKYVVQRLRINNR